MTGKLPLFLRPEDPRKLRREYRARKAANPAFFRAMRNMTTDELRELEAEVLRDEINRLRALPKFRSSPELQSRVAEHEFALRLNEDFAWHKAHPVRRQVKRYRSKHDPAPVVEPAVPVLPWSKITPMPDLPSALAAEPTTAPETEEPADKRFVSKFFNTPRHPYDSW